MLATFVIGLREGLEAALIVGIIAAFLKQSNRPDALRKVWAGVAAAVVLCLAVGLLLQLLSASLPQRQQEMLECVVAAIAVLMVSYMVLWMRAHSRDLKSNLQNATGSALARGSAGALVAMAFLAVIREGFETAVFLLAAFQSAISPAQAAIGVILGVAVAVGLGYLVYRGGVRLNLSRFFRVTGVVLVLVAAGLVMSTLRAAYEAGWLTVGQQTWLDLSAVARPGSVQESLLTGMLGIRSSLPVVEVVAYLLYAVPMLLVVLWPPRRTPSTRTLGRILVGTASGALAVAGLLAALAPAAAGRVGGEQGPFAMQGTTTAGTDPATGRPRSGEVLTGSVELTVASDTGSADLRASTSGSEIAGVTVLTATGHRDVNSADGTTLSATVRSGTPLGAAVDPVAAGLPATMTVDQLATVNGGRLPVGIRSGESSSQATQTLPVRYVDRLTPTVSLGNASGAVLGVESRLARAVQVNVPARGWVPAGTLLEGSMTTTAAGVAAGLTVAADVVASTAAQQVVAQVIPGLLVLFAVVLLAFGVPKLMAARRRRNVAAVGAPDAVTRPAADQPDLDQAAVDQAAVEQTGPDLAHAVARPPAG